MEHVATFVITSLLLPPGLNVLLSVLGVLLLWRSAGTGKALIILSLVSLYVFSIPATGRLLLAPLERYEPITRETNLGGYYQAIVVLGGGRTRVMPEYGSEVPSANTLERVRFAVRLHKQTGLPILVSGGRASGEGKSEAQTMTEVMVEDYGIRPRWVESDSRNTAGNARYSKSVLQSDGIDKVLLVTHASHMRRAEYAFRNQDFNVKPAPTIYRAGGTPSWSDWMPSALGLALCWEALHEHVGYAWYLVRY